MDIVKYTLIIIWTLLLLGIICFVIKQLVLGKRKTNWLINTSEAIYLASLLLSAAIIFQDVIKFISNAYDNLHKLNPENMYFQIIKTNSVLTVTGFIIFILCLYAAKFLNAIFFGYRKDIIEFESDNTAYAIIRGTLTFAITFIIIHLCEPVFTYLIPNITIPFYR